MHPIHPRLQKDREQIVCFPVGIDHDELDATFSQIRDEFLVCRQHVLTHKLRRNQRRRLIGHVLPNLDEVQKACRQYAFQQVFPKLQPVADDPTDQSGLIVKCHAPVFQAHVVSRKTKKTSEIHTNDLSSLPPPTQILVKIIAVTSWIRTIQARQQIHIVCFVLDWESYVIWNGLVGFTLAVNNAVGVGNDLFFLCFFQHALFEGWIDFLINWEPVYVEAAIQPEVIFKMPDGCDPRWKTFMVPALKCFRPEAHLHERNSVYGLEMHISKKTVAFVHALCPYTCLRIKSLKAHKRR